MASGVPSKQNFAGFPRGSPSRPKPWRFAAWRIWNSRSASCLPATAAEAFVPEWQNPWPKPLVPPDEAMSEAPGSRRFRSSRDKARSCPTIRSAEASLVPVAVRKPEGPAFRRAVPEPRRIPDPACPVPFARRPPVPGGRFTKPAAFASAKGQVRSFRLAAASSAAPPPLSTFRLVGRKASSLGLWPGRLSSVAGRSSLPRIESCHEK